MHIRRDVLVLLSLKLSISLFASAQVPDDVAGKSEKPPKALSPFVMAGYELNGKGFKIPTGFRGAGLS